MNYTIEDVSPVEKKVTIVVGKEEVNASISATVALYMSDKNVSIPGFRPGHVPVGVIESRYRKHVYTEAREDLVNVQVNKLASEANITPLNTFTVDTVSEFERDHDFTIVLKFEVFPEITLPPYEGLTVNLEKLSPSPDYLKRALESIRYQHAKTEPIEGNGPAVDNQVVNIDFFFTTQKGEELKEFTEKNYECLVDSRQFLPEVYELVKTTTLGQKAEKEVFFPLDFVNEKLAGQKLTLHLQVNAIKNVVLPEFTDEFLKQLGYKDRAEMEEKLLESEKKTLDILQRSKAEKELAEQLIKLCDFPVPNFYRNTFQRILFDQYKQRLARVGRAVKNEDEVYASFADQALHDTRIFMLLVAIARKENLNVPDREVEEIILNEAKSMGQDPKALRDYYERNGVVFFIRDRLLADKASRLVYERANVVMTEPAEKDAKDSASAEKTEEAAPQAQEGEKSAN